MIEIYNEQVRDLLSTDGNTKKYPFSYFTLICQNMMFDLMSLKLKT